MTAPAPARPAVEAEDLDLSAMTVACAGCGAVVAPREPFPARCPAARPGDDVDHLMTRRIDLRRVALVASDDPNPFVRYRQLFRAWHLARATGWSDERYVGLVRRLDDAVAAVDGHGFRVTPFGRSTALSDRLGFAATGGVWVKDETGGVAGSHKARHLAGIMLELLVAEALDPGLSGRPLAIASCGNAALAAAVVARAAGRRLDVFVPPDAEPAVLDRLRRLGAEVEVVSRVAGQPGDPTVRRMAAAVAGGAIPFTCQGPANGLAIEGAQTLGYELAEALAASGDSLDRLVVQVGGGALASACAAGLAEARELGASHVMPRFDTVQTTGAWPLRRAYERVAAAMRASGLDPSAPLDLEAPRARRALEDAARHRSTYMWPWESEPRSIAHGILDDETYDWLAVVRAMLASGGQPIVVEEAELRDAAALADPAGFPADATGSAGLAGLIHLRLRSRVSPSERVGVLMTGIRRDASHQPRPRPTRTS